MNDIKLIKQNKPEFEELFEMISAIKNFLEEDADINNTKWNENIDKILDFQDENGSFSLLTSYRVPSDARVDFCHTPTYICTAILMKAYLTDSTLKEKVEPSLIKGLEMCCLRNLTGHGYDGLKGQIEALNIFIEGGLREFIDLQGDLNPKFTEMILNIQYQFKALEAHKHFNGPWGEDYKEDILKINKYFATRQVFVYGTLMKDESNHHFLRNSTFIEAVIIKGYDMYNVGYFPAIIPGENIVIGELYEVPVTDMPSIDMLEGEGSLYIRKCEITQGASGEKTLAYIYEYAQDVSDLEQISSWKDDAEDVFDFEELSSWKDDAEDVFDFEELNSEEEYVWYVSYGSNMLYERFLCYIEGGFFEDGGSYNDPCEDTSAPVEVRTLEIPYDMYFGNYSGSWNGCGVSFLDTTQKGKAFGVAYLITRKQFEHVAAQENGGRFPGYGSWYEDIKTFGEMDGFDLVTITNDDLRPYNEPCKEYVNTLARGIRENWPEMSDEDIDNYLDSCIRG